MRERLTPTMIRKRLTVIRERKSKSSKLTVIHKRIFEKLNR